MPTVTQDRILEAYQTPGHPVAFSAPAAVARHYRRRGVTEEKARKALEHVDSYVLHKEFKRPRVFNPYYVHRRRKLVQCDLIDVRALRNHNDGVQHLLLLIDVFSRRVWVYPLVNKSALVTRAAFEEWLWGLSISPDEISHDEGKEFLNKDVKELMLSHNIKQTIATGTSKAAYAERANKSIQILLYKYLTHTDGLRYIDALEDLVLTYNRRPHRSLKNMSPLEADKASNSGQVLAAAMEKWRRVEKRRKGAQLSVGDVVRIKTVAHKVATTSRAYAQQFKGEYFEVERVSTKMPIPLYFLKSQDTGESIRGGFYSNELSRVRSNVYRIDSILRYRGRGRRREALVRWRYFGPEHDSWIPASDVTRI